MVLLHVRIAERGFDSPQAKHDRAANAVILLDPGEQAGIFLGFFLARRDAPVRDTAIEILPQLLVKLGLSAIEREYTRIRLNARHHPRVGRVGYAAREGAFAKESDPVLEALALCRRPPAQHQPGRQYRQARAPRQGARPLLHGAAPGLLCSDLHPILSRFLSALRPSRPLQSAPRNKYAETSSLRERADRGGRRVAPALAS